MGIGPIPASAIERRTRRMDYRDAALFEFCIRRMDEVYLMHQNKADKPDLSVSPRDAFRAATSRGRRR